MRNSSKNFCLNRVNEIRGRALNLTNRLEIKNQLSESDRSFYYYSWLYSMVRLLTAVERFQTVEAISKELGLPINKIRNILDFLISRGLCVESENRIKYGPVSTYIEASSPLVARHHLNWRQKTQERFENIREQDLIFTFPGVISEVDAYKIREKIVQLIEEIKKISDPSPSELPSYY